MLLPRRFALVLPVLVAGYFLLTAYVVEYGVHGIEKTSLGSSWAGTHLSRPDWIDRLVGRNAKVSVLWTESMPTAYPVWENEFFNRSVGKVYDVDGALRRDPLPEIDANRASNGDLVVGGKPVTAQYVLANSAVELGGKRIKQDPLGVDLYRVNGPIVILSHVGGLYRNDTWSGKTATYQRVECTGGSLDRDAAGRRPALQAAADGRRDRGRAGSSAARDPGQQGDDAEGSAHAVGDHRCDVRFTAGRTLVPARVQPGSTDLRPLGAHYLAWNYHPPR